jgi:putative DNA primase/helicase
MTTNTANSTTEHARTQAKTPLACAQGYIARGWSPIPLKANSKQPIGRDWNSLRIDASTAPQHFNGTPCNIGILLGEPSGGLVDIDLDCPEAIALADAFLPPTDALFGRDSTGRAHRLYTAHGFKREPFTDPDAPKDSAMLVEIRGTGGQTMFPPSIHPCGEAVRWHSDGDPAAMDADTLRRQVSILAASALIVRRWDKGNRQDLTMALAGALLQSGQDVDEVSRFLEHLANAAGDRELKDRRAAVEATARKVERGEPVTGKAKLKELLGAKTANAIIKWLGLKGTTKPLVLGCTDADNARRFAARFERDARYCRPWKDWLLYEGGRWARDERGQTVLMAETVARGIFEEAARADQKDEAVALSKWANSSLSKRALDAMVALAQSHLAISPGEFDQAPWLFNVRNGTVDLRIGELRQPERDDLLTKQAPILFDADAACPTWERFLLEIMGGNAALVDYLRRAAGYSLTGSTREQCLFILYGTGRNGKSTFIETMNAALGEYSRKAEMRAFLNKGDNAGVNNDIAALRGARLVSAVEIGAERRLNEPLIKEITGGDTITARFLFGEFFEFRPEFKVFLAVNHKPVIKGTDEGIWRRVRLVPFDVTIAPEKVDKELPEKLRAELPGILNWAIRGCLEWQRDGLQDPPEVLGATEEYRAESDTVAPFVNECCILGEGKSVPAGKLFEEYEQWCKGAGEFAQSKTQFRDQLRALGIEPAKLVRPGGGQGPVRCYHGIGLLANVPDPASEQVPDWV